MKKPTCKICGGYGDGRVNTKSDYLTFCKQHIKGVQDLFNKIDSVRIDLHNFLFSINTEGDE